MSNNLLVIFVSLLCFAVGCNSDPGPVPLSPPPPSKPQPAVPELAIEALDEVNAARAKRGLPAFVRDDALTQAAKAAAIYRAGCLLAGHTANDFAYLPQGAHAEAAGCGALPDDWGWGTCCTFDDWHVAGAAWARGSDGQRYMHLFVR